MRILMTTDTVGGVWTFTKQLASELLQHGCTVMLVSFARLPQAAQTLSMQQLQQRFPAAFTYEASAAPLEWMQGNDLAYDEACEFLLRACADFQPDVLLANQFCFGALPVEIPVIVVAHSDVFSWAAAVGRAPLQEDTWLRTYRTLVQRGLGAADAVVAPTHAALQDLQRHFAFTAEAHVIPNGRTLLGNASSSSRSVQAVAAGRMWDQAKNLPLLLRVDSPIPVRIAGDPGNTHVASERLAGELQETDLIALFRSSAIYICSSLYEPFGLAPLEAALCGCAVLASDIPSLREVWAGGALYFEDQAGLSALLHMLAGDPVRLTAAQQRSRERAERYSASTMANAYLQLMSRMVQDRSQVQANAA